MNRGGVGGNAEQDGFDLDLTYITPRIIAMGYPSKGLESNYRNSVEDVYRFFQERHAAHHLVVNLCSEREYSLDTFHGSCVRYPFHDHTPPALELLLPCCARMHRFLQADPDNVVAVHCKAGKGRTGLVVVAYLMYCGHQPSVAAARRYYDWVRTKDGSGLTIVSQIRYAHYFEHLLRSLRAPGDGPASPLLPPTRRRLSVFSAAATAAAAAWRRTSVESLPAPAGTPGSFSHSPMTLYDPAATPIRTRESESPAVRILGFRLHSAARLDSGGGGGGGPGLSFTILVKSDVDHDGYEVFSSAGQAGASVWACRLDPHSGCCDIHPVERSSAGRATSGDVDLSNGGGGGADRARSCEGGSSSADCMGSDAAANADRARTSCLGECHFTDETVAECELGPRVAGDFCVSFYYAAAAGGGGVGGRRATGGEGSPPAGESARRAFFFWLHSSFLEHPPPEMCGAARLLGGAEREEVAGAAGGGGSSSRGWRLPPGARSLTLRKHEVTGASLRIRARMPLSWLSHHWKYFHTSERSCHFVSAHSSECCVSL